MSTPTLSAFAADLTAGVLPDDLANLIKRPDFTQWADQVLAARGCAKPVRLAGSSTILDHDGATLDETSGRVFVPCKSRRASVCVSCSAHYAHDTYHLVHAGMAGGKTVPDSVVDNALHTDDVLRRTIRRLDIAKLLTDVSDVDALNRQLGAAVTAAVKDALVARLRDLL